MAVDVETVYEIYERVMKALFETYGKEAAPLMKAGLHPKDVVMLCDVHGEQKPYKPHFVTTHHAVCGVPVDGEYIATQDHRQYFFKGVCGHELKALETVE